LTWTLVWSQGFTPKISLFDADLGKSGTLRIDQRTGLQELVERIKADEVKAVLVYQVSRLFRDETGVQYNVFANICREHNCLLVTADGMIFNFRNPMHLKMFRFLAEMAAEFIPQQVGLLHAARLRKARKGLYVGLGPVTTGYIVDYDKHNLTYRKFIIYLPHARVIVWIFERYYALGGNLSLLCRELADIPVLFPEFESWVDQRNSVLCKRKRVPGGYHLSRPGLEYILTNPIYLGWWIVQGDIVSRSNHEPIIDAEHEYLFWYAFNRISPYTTDGKKNEHRDGVGEPTRFYHKRTRQDDGLLKDRITSPYAPVYVHRNDTYRYLISPSAGTLSSRGDSEIDVSVIDIPFKKRFFEHLQETHDFDIYKKWLAEEEQKQQTRIVTIGAQLAEIERQQEDILTERLAIRRQINSIEDEKQREQAEKQSQPTFDRLQKRSIDLDTLAAELKSSLPNEQERRTLGEAKKYASFQTELLRIIPVWDKIPFAKRKEFVNLLVKRAVVEVVAPHWVRLTISWLHPAWTTDIMDIRRTRGAKPIWTEEERAIIREKYPDRPREEILELLPNKSWASIKNEALMLGVRRTLTTPSNCAIPIFLSFADWQFMQKREQAEKDQTTNEGNAS
jgi:DNA invertase Pin-like site-specific DNA recombinase